MGLGMEIYLTTSVPIVRSSRAGLFTAQMRVMLGSSLSGKIQPLATGVGSGSDDGGAVGRPEREARRESVYLRMPDGRCEATKQPCRLCETVAAPLATESLDDIRAMLVEIRAGVMGPATGKPAGGNR